VNNDEKKIAPKPADPPAAAPTPEKPSEKILENEKLAIFQQINSWIQHLNHIGWTVTSLFWTLNVIVFWKFINNEMIGKNLCIQNFIKCYRVFIGFQLYFLACIGAITMKLGELLNDNDLTREKLKGAVEIDPLSSKFYKEDLKLMLKSFIRPWGLLLLACYIIFLFKLFRL